MSRLALFMSPKIHLSPVSVEFKPNLRSASHPTALSFAVISESFSIVSMLHGLKCSRAYRASTPSNRQFVCIWALVWDLELSRGGWTELLQGACIKLGAAGLLSSVFVYGARLSYLSPVLTPLSSCLKSLLLIFLFTHASAKLQLLGPPLHIFPLFLRACLCGFKLSYSF